MYTLCVSSSFIAQHHMTGGNWGTENEPHSHCYTVEALLEGSELDQHGYLVDAVYVEAQLEAILRRYRDQLLNDLPEFEEINPSQERFARLLCEAFATHIHLPQIRALSIKVCEDHRTWASYRMTF